MLSIPRDLYVKNPVWWKTKLNAVFSWLLWRNKDFNEAGSWYAKMLEDITGLSIPYYATIDFSWFKKIVDDLGGIDIYVPYSIHDYQYPDENLKGYDPLHVEEWWQHMDWALALKYARSRHAAWHASDYDRSYRQQLVISAIKDKVFSWWSISLNRAKDLYESYSDMVKTNISLNEMLWTVQYVEKTKFFTFWLNVSYSDNLAYSQKGGFLYNVPQERYGASATLPFWASYGKENQYDIVHQYADFIAHLQGFSLDNATIAVDNWISKETLREQNLQNTKVAGRLAAKMKRYGLNVVSSENVDPQDFTTVFINTENEKPEGYEGTITAIKNFLPVDQIVYNTWTVKVITDDYWNMVEVFTGTDVQIILWTSYLTYLQEQGFKPNELNLIYYEE